MLHPMSPISSLQSGPCNPFRRTPMSDRTAGSRFGDGLFPDGIWMPRRLLCAVLVFVPAVAALGALPLLASDKEPDVLEPMSAITEDGAREAMKVLTSADFEGRRAGTEGARKAAAFLAKEFEKAGLKPGGPDGSWLQPVTVPRPARAGKNNSLRIVGEKKNFDLEPLKDFAPLGFSATGVASGPVFFAGYGLSASDLGWDDFEGADAKGKVVLVLRHAPGGKWQEKFGGREGRERQSFRAKVVAAQNAGATALLVVTDPANMENGDPLAFLAGGDEGEAVHIPCVHVKSRVGLALVALAGKTLKGVQDEMNRTGAPVRFDIPKARVEIETDVVSGTTECANVVGLLEGADPELCSECVVIGGHYDHLGFGDIGALGGKPGQVYPGADDNASGVVAIVEVAKAFGASPFRPRRSIVFVAFTGEEVGLIGSEAYARQPRFPVAKTVAMIDLDMVGRVKNNRMTVMGVGSGDAFKALLEDAGKEAKLDLNLAMASYPGSDHTPFHNRKIPSLFFCSGVHPDYHRPTDTGDKVNYEGLAKTARVVFLAAARLASMDGRPAFKGSDPSRGEGNRPRLGIMPDMQFKGKGARIESVTPGSAADDAGFEDGDVIVEFGGKPVEAMSDLFRLLGGVKGGSELKVAVLRDGKRVELTVKMR
jgi:aminopeptidase YwaD